MDLSKGMYDAGDNMKFGFPMAFTATVLSWSILEYGDQMDHVGQLDAAQDSLKWITDFLINAHPSENVLYMLFVEFNNENIQILFLLIFHCNFNYSCFSTLIKPLFSFNFNFLVTTFLVWFKIEFCLTFSNGYIRVRSSKHGFWCYQYVSNELPSQ